MSFLGKREKHHMIRISHAYPGSLLVIVTRLAPYQLL